MRKIALLCSSASVALMLAGCGGSSSPPEDQTTFGRMLPAAQGVVVAEYASNGEVLQLSSASSADGSFVFKRRLTGVRVASVVQADDSRVPDDWSALVTSPDALLLTPVSTMREQVVRFGGVRTEVDSALVRLVTASCGSEAGEQVRAALDSQTSTTAPSDWLVRTTAAYVRALKDLGIVPTSTWMNTLNDRSAVLQRMCATGRQIVQDPAWLDQLALRVPDVLKLGAADRRAVLEQAQLRALDEILRLIGTSAAALEHPELSGLFEPQIAQWRDREIDVALQLGEAVVTTKLARSQVLSALADAPVDAAAPASTLTRSGDVWQVRSSTIETGASGWSIQNQSDTERTVRLAIDGVPLFDRSNLIREMLRIPKQSPDEGLQMRAWRFVTRWREPEVPFTSGLFQHQVDLYLRSVGAGRCDDDASALSQLWTMLGFESRIWGIGGHIVAEVLVNGRWEIYDPHYGVYYLTRDGRVASLEELENDASLMLDPVLNLDPGSDAYKPVIADVYTETSDNVLLRFYSVATVEPMTSVVAVPPGASLEVVAGQSLSFPSLVWSDPKATVDTAQVRLHLPPNFPDGTIELPLVLADATGSGTLTASGITYTVGPAGIKAGLQQYYDSGPRTSAPDVGINRVLVRGVGPEGMTLSLMLNARYFKKSPTHTLTVRSPDFDGLRIVAGSAS